MVSAESSFPSQIGLASLMAAALLTIGSTMFVIYVLLVRIELQSTLTFGDSDEVELKENSTEGDNKEGKNKTSKTDAAANGKSQGYEDTSVGRRLHLPLYRRGVLAAVVAMITFMSYLLLALSNANVLLCWIGMFAVLGLLLRQTIFEEVRRERMDRLMAILSLVFLLAMALNLAVYANRQHAQGDIYEGKARIVGYDSSSYNQDKNDKVLRTDLEVEWGGWWGCPNLPSDSTCRGKVAGALCETKEDEGDSGGNHRVLSQQATRRRRRNQSTSARRVAEDEQDESKNGDESQDGADQDQSRAQNDGDDKNAEDYEAENEELEQENEQLEEENEELENENEELEEEVEEYEEAADEEEEEVEELYEEEQMYTFDDDMYYDEYWGEMSWSDVWGEYACEDLFASEMEGETYDQSTPPGSDNWPFVNIYGNCDTCDAYIVDFYSTEHFQSILSYKKAGLRYGIMSGLSLIVTGILMARQRASGNGKSMDKGIELLPSSAAGALA